VITPSTVTLQSGGTQAFSAAGVWSDGSTRAVNVTWQAAGGTISGTGLYTAGATPGSYPVVATETTTGLTAQAAVTLAAPPLPTGVSIFPGQSIQTAVDQNPIGTTFIIKAGVHRLQSVTPKTGDTFIGEPGAVLSSARLLTGFTQQGNVWVIGGQTQQGPVHGQCQAAYPRCSRPEELFLDDVRQRHVASVAAVTAGTWFFDYALDTIYMGTNPTGRKVETSVTRNAFKGPASDVTLRNLTVEKYASGAQEGAILQTFSGQMGAGWTVDTCTVQLNHGSGINLWTNMHVVNSRILRNGQIGVSGGNGQPGIVVDGNEIAYNNEAGFDPGWEGGGTKFWATTNLIVRNNYVHHNYGPGLWADFDNDGTLYDGNTVEDNAWAGIFHEISYAAVIRNNIVRRNGLQDPRGWYWRAGILIAASSNVEIDGNTLEGNAHAIVGIQQNRGSGSQGPWLIQNLWVHDNTITVGAYQVGLVTDTGDNAIFTSRNNHFDQNTYNIGSSTRPFIWMNGSRTDSEWRAFGQDLSGFFNR
jgi:parallel beta-helix repeat protein